MFEIDDTRIGHDTPPYIIAELSANHNGRLDLALKTIEAAKDCGANAVKIQTYTPDTMTIDCDGPEFIVQSGLWRGYTLYDLYKEAHTPFEWHDEIFKHAKDCGITIFSTPFDEFAVDLLEGLGAPAYKIASFELVDLPLIRYVAATGKPMIMSTGMASEGEISEAVAAAREAGCENLVPLHCISSYPAPIDQLNLRQIAVLADQFDVIAGLSDHTLGTTASVAAIALGARVIEKHFTLNCQQKGPDSEFSIEPEELRELCGKAHDVWSALGIGDFKRQEGEEINKIFRRSLYFVRDLDAGSVVSEGDIRRIRPGMGLSPRHLRDVIGQRLKVAVTRGTAVNWDLIED